MAGVNINEILLKITGDDEDARNSIEKFVALLGVLDDAEADPTIDLDAGPAMAKLAVLAAAIKALDSEDVTIDIEVDRDRLDAATGGARGLEKAVKGLGGGLSALGNSFGTIGVNIGPFTTALNPATAAVISLAIAMGTLLVGAMVAVAASAAAAAAGVAAMATAFAAALGPAVLIAVAAVAKFANILQVLKAEEADAEDRAKRQIQGNKQIAAAAEQRADAARGLARAEEALGRAATAAYRAMADAAEDASDAVRELAQAELSREQAALNLDKAQLALKEFRDELGLTGLELDNTFKKFVDVKFDDSKLKDALRNLKPGGATLDVTEQLELRQKILDVRQARLSEKDAIDGVSDSTTKLNRAQQLNNQYLQQGILANDAYRASLQARDDASRGLARATQDQADALNAVTAATAKAQAGREGLTSAEEKLLDVLKKSKDLFSNLFGPATDRIFLAIAKSIEMIGTALQPLRGLFGALGRSIGNSILTMTKAFTGKKTVGAIGRFTELMSRLGGPITDMVISFFTLLGQVAIATAPYLIPLFEGMSNFFKALAGKASDASTMNGVMATLVEHTKSWFNLFAQFGRVVLEVFKIAAPFGKQLIDDIAQSLSNFADSLKDEKGREELKLFFKDAVAFAKDFITALTLLINVFIRLGIFTKTVFDGIGEVIKAIDTALQAVEKFIGKIDKALVDAGKSIVDFFVGLPDKLADVATDLFNLGKDLGVQIAEGLLDGIKSIPGKIKKGAEDLGKDAIGFLGRKLKINSPSKVTVGFGKGIVEGLILGMENMSNQLGSGIENSIATPIVSGLSPVAAQVPAGVGLGGPRAETIIEKQEVILPPAPGGGLGDERAAAMALTNELRRRGR